MVDIHNHTVLTERRKTELLRPLVYQIVQSGNNVSQYGVIITERIVLNEVS